MANEDLEARHLETLDRDLGRFVKLETAASYVSRPLVAPGIALVFIMLAGLGAAMLLGHSSQMFIVVAAAVFGAYMALNIGANDVANNMGPAVGANALSMGGAIAIAAIFESAGALIAGADVVSTVATGIIAPDTLATPVMFIWAMMAALPCGCRRRRWGGYRCGWLWSGELVADGRNRGKLGYLARAGCDHSRRFSLADQSAYRLPRG